MDDIKYGPSEAKGREFKDDPNMLWVWVSLGDKEMYGKIASPDVLDAAYNGKPFLLWHPYMKTEKGMIYLPAVTQTIEPWFMTKCDCAGIVHHRMAATFDEQTKKLFSNIVLATEMPKEPKSGFIKV